MDADLVIARIAHANHGFVRRRDAIDAGVTAAQLDQRCRDRSIRAMGAGVYDVFGLRNSTAVIALAALSLPSGAAALQSAAFLHGIWREPAGLPSVVVPHSSTNRSGRAEVLQSRHLPPVDLTVIDGIRATTVARTVVDLVPRLSPDVARRLVTAALAHTDLTVDQLVACDLGLARRGRPGVAKRRKVLGPLIDDRHLNLSVLEREFLVKYRAEGLPPLEVQFEPPWYNGVEGIVDFAVVDARLIIEVDGRSWHSTVDALERDQRRDRRARRHGWNVARFSWTEVQHRWAEVCAELHHCLRVVASPTS